MVALGVGKNMVRAIRFWVQAAGIARVAAGNRLEVTALGHALLAQNGHDPFLEDIKTLWLIHWNISTLAQEPLFAWFYLLNHWRRPEFSRTEYADTLSPSAQKEWEAVAGRFEEITFSKPPDQTALRVSRALGVDTAQLPKARLAEIRSDLSATIDLGWYGAASDRKWLKEVVAGTFPLRPTVLPVVVNLFRRFGQNERSLFGFLPSGRVFRPT